ncbi:hypothetical protein ABD87_14755 [Lysinibacillus sphaericus]|uniref:conjugal transfer protein n=1 Tax=Lysinibacillus sphaericus TaxID=1421 RepID=UPI0018CEA7E3|nr:conjugal transfer protein [Lysinibacillus sphaericus]MBG9730759.1 hypothetical protein [Lysinibacillus sphaericus]
MKKKPRSHQKDGESKIKSLFSASKNVVNKQRDIEDQKKQKKKEKKAQQIVPQGFVARKLGIIGFWVLFSFMFLVVMVSLFSKDKGQAIETTANVDSALSISNVQGVDFAKEFLYTYLNFTEDTKDDYANNLAYYIDSSVDLSTLAQTQSAGGFESLTERNNITLVDTQNISDTEAMLTFKVSTTFAKKINAYENVVVFQKNEKGSTKSDTTRGQTEQNQNESNDSNMSKQNTSGEEIRVRVPKESYETTKYIQVRITYISDVGRYAVAQFPSYVGFDNTTQVNSGSNTDDKLKEVDSATNKDIESFLPTFFNSYLKDDKGTLAYILKDSDNSVGLVGTDLELQNISNVVAYEGLENDEYLVVANVVFKDTQTKITLPSVYHFVIQPQNNKFVVVKLNDMEYLNKLKNRNSSTSKKDNEKIKTSDKKSDSTSDKKNSDNENPPQNEELEFEETNNTESK